MLKVISRAIVTGAFAAIATASMAQTVVDPVIITGQNPAPPPQTNPTGSGLGGSVGASAGSAKSRIQALVRKAATEACRKTSESCADWAARMLTPLGQPVLNSDGAPTGPRGLGLCTAAGVSATFCKEPLAMIVANGNDDEGICAAVKCP